MRLTARRQHGIDEEFFAGCVRLLLPRTPNKATLIKVARNRSIAAQARGCTMKRALWISLVFAAIAGALLALSFPGARAQSSVESAPIYNSAPIQPVSAGHPPARPGY